MLVLAASPTLAETKCKLVRLAEIPVTLSGLRPVVNAKINGTEATFLLDSGAFYSMISSATATQFHLRLEPAPHGFKVIGIGGTAETSIATVRTFTLVGIDLPNVQFLVGGSEIGSGAVGMLGQNFLEKWDDEYDFANGVARLMKPDGCKHTMLAYWLKPDQPISMMDISSTTAMRAGTKGTATINGAKITVMFDTGAWTSVLSLKAAARAGVKIDTAGVLDIGYMRGIGRGTVKTYSAPFSSFKIGDGEEIKNTRLRIADIDLDEADMLLGADFFASHHVYVANSQRRAYFTYNGGPVFNLANTTSAAASGAKPEIADGNSDEVVGAAALARRGAAAASRRDFVHALADLSRACELEPDNAEYAYGRGMANWDNHHPIPAMQDFDRALQVDPNYLPARLSRAELRIATGDKSGAAEDADAADRIAPPQADARFQLSQLYQKADLLDTAIAELDLWIAHHPDDSKMTSALRGRCWLRGLQDRELGKALSDCNAALRRIDKRSPLSAEIFSARGLVRLRAGDYQRAIADFDETVKLEPQNAWALYGRGIAKRRLKMLAAGEEDASRAASLAPAIAEDFSRRGIAP